MNSARSISEGCERPKMLRYRPSQEIQEELYLAELRPSGRFFRLAVIVFWSRIGSQLPTGFELKEDDTPYLSGTEWEYLNALEAYRSNGRPAVWVYRRKGAPNPHFSPDRHDLA
jgi:hypothetical protein